MSSTERLWIWQSGPDCSGQVRLAAGRYVIGRAAQADVRCDDPALAAHHALLDIGADGAARVVQLAGRRPLPPNTGDGPIEVGGSVLVAGAAEAPATKAHIRDGTVLREPRVIPAWDEPQFAEPEGPAGPGARHGALLPALLALAAAGAVAVVLRQPMFVIFGAIGAVVAVGTWAAQRLGGRRERLRDGRRHATATADLMAAVDAACARFVEHHRASTPTVAAAAATIAEHLAPLWSRRAGHHDTYLVAVGTGDLLWQPRGLDPIRARVLTGESIPADLGPGSRMAVRGDTEAAAAIVRGLVIQLAASCGPADLHVAVIASDPSTWSWIDGLPHAVGTAGRTLLGAEEDTQRMLDELAGEGAGGHVLVLTDRLDLLATRTHPLRRFVMSDREPALIAVVPPAGAIPHLCTSELHLGRGGGAPAARWVASTAAGIPQHLRTSGLSARSATRLVGRLRGLSDPEDALTARNAVARNVDLRQLLTERDAGALTPAAIAASWLAGGNDPPPRGVLGRAIDGVVDVDLVRDGPHALMAGTTGAGKSELLHSLVIGMACGASPAHLNFVLVDYKGGSTFDRCAPLPHVVGVVTDLDERLADRALRSLHAELHHREERLRAYGCADLTSFRDTAPHEVLSRLVVIIDEFAALVAEQPGFLDALVGVAQRGRSLGVHLILATQRPQGVITEAIRANTNLRLALRLQDTADALDVVGAPSPALIPRHRPGRAVMRLGADEFVEFQTARLAAGDELVAAIAEAWTMTGGTPPRCPWQPPLPAVIEPGGGRLGLVDDPDRQAINDLRWRPADGNLLLVGANGNGLTTALTAIGAAALSDPATHVYVIDAYGDDALRTLCSSPRCAAVVGLHEHERLARLLARLAGAPTDDAQAVLLIDGYPALRQQLDDLDTAAEYDALEHILTTAGHVTAVLTADRPSAVPAAVLARCAQRWVFHLRDAYDATLLGVPAGAVPAAGRPGRVLLAPAGLEAQLSLPAPVPADGAAAPPIEVMAAAVSAAELPCPTAAEGTLWLPCGRQFASGEVAALRVHDGEHLLVVGPARSGRSTTLAQLAARWRHAHPAGLVLTIRSPRAPFRDADVDADGATAAVDAAQSTADRPVLLVVDDAELVDDPGGRLAALAAARRRDVLILAAGRPDALRQAYGHWTTVVRRSRLGIAMSGCGDLDGDLLGAALPRRLPVPARPGLAWLLGDGPPLLTQLAM